MNLFLIRHGQCGTMSVDDILTPRGEEQARLLGERLKSLTFTTIVSSPLLRALATASIIAQHTTTPQIEVWPELREGLYEQYLGHGQSYLHQLFPETVFPYPMEEQQHFYEADTQESMIQRCKIVLERLRNRFGPDDTIALVFHGGMITYFLNVLLQIPLHTLRWFDMDYTALSQIRLPQKEMQQSYLPLYPTIDIEVLSLNDRLHLAALDL